MASNTGEQRMMRSSDQLSLCIDCESWSCAARSRAAQDQWLNLGAKRRDAGDPGDDGDDGRDQSSDSADLTKLGSG